MRGVDPRVERALGRLSEWFTRVGDLAGDGSDRARIDEVAFLQHRSGSGEEVHVRRRGAVGLGDDRFEQLPVHRTRRLDDGNREGFFASGEEVVDRPDRAPQTPRRSG